MRHLLRCALLALAALAVPASAQDGSEPAGADPVGSQGDAGEAQAALDAAIAEFEAAEAALDEAYARAREAMPPSAFERLRLEQREWVAARDVAAEYYAEVMAGPDVADPRATSHFYEYLTGATEDRTALLAGLAAYHEDPSSQRWEGLWVDGAGGHLAVQELDDGRLRFQLTVVRSPAFHTGWIEGVARRNGGLAVHETTYETAEGEEPVWVFFVRDGPYLRVHTANASHFAGMRAYFDASYVRLRDLEPFDID